MDSRFQVELEEDEYSRTGQSWMETGSLWPCSSASDNGFKTSRDCTVLANFLILWKRSCGEYSIASRIDSE